MKIQYKDQSFQTDAAKAVVDVLQVNLMLQILIEWMLEM